MDNPPTTLRTCLSQESKKLGRRAEMFWELCEPFHSRQTRPDCNENGRKHCEGVEANIWRLLTQTRTQPRSIARDAFQLDELFLLSCAACCHDVDKGLKSALPEGAVHGQGSGQFVVKHAESLVLEIPEATAIELIVSIHGLETPLYQEELKALPRQYATPLGPRNLQRLAVLLKTADILHTDSSRISNLAVDVTKLEGEAKEKHLARQCIFGWTIDGTRIVVQARPASQEQLEAVERCRDYMKEQEWPTVAEQLPHYGFPYTLEFEVFEGRGKSLLLPVAELKASVPQLNHVTEDDKTVLPIASLDTASGLKDADSAVDADEHQVVEAHARPTSASRFSQTKLFSEWEKAWADHEKKTLGGEVLEFVGREAELGALKEAVDSAEVRAVILCGPQGIGKTRLALEGTKHRQADTVMACDVLNLTVNGVLGLLSASRDTIIIVDEPEPRKVEQLVGLALTERNLRLVVTVLTLEDTGGLSYGLDDRIRTLLVKPLGDEESYNLLKAAAERFNKHLDYSLESWIASQAGGNPGLIVLATSVGEDLREEGFSFVTRAAEVLEQRIRGALGTDAIKALRLLSLLTHVGLAGDALTDVRCLCKHFGSGTEANEVLNQLGRLQSAGLVRCAGSHARVLQPNLANHLAASALLGRYENLLALFSELGPKGKERLVRRLVSVKSDEVELFWDWLFSDDGPFKDLSCALAQAALFETTAKAVPQKSAALVCNSLREIDLEKRLAIQRSQRDRLKWAMEEAFFHRASCSAALKAMALLAEVETEDRFANDAKGLFCECFSPDHPQFPMPLPERVEILGEVLSEDSSVELRLVGVRAIKAGLSRLGPIALRRSEGLRPYDRPPRKTGPQVCWYLGKLLDMLMDICQSRQAELSKAACAGVPDALQRFVHLVPPEQSTPVFEKAVGMAMEGQSTIPVAELSAALFSGITLFRSESQKAHTEDGLAGRCKEAREKLEELDDRLRNACFELRLKRCAGSWTYKDLLPVEDTEVDVSGEELKGLAEEIVRDRDVMTESLWEWLLSREAEKGYVFFQMLGQTDRDHVLLSKIDEIGAMPNGATAFSSYYVGLSILEPDFVANRLDELTADRKVTGNSIVSTIPYLKGDANAIERIETLIEQGRVEPKTAGLTLRGGGWVNTLSAEDFVRLVRVIWAENREHGPEVLDLFELWIHYERPIEGEVAELAWKVLESLPADSYDNAYHIDVLASRVAHSDKERAFSLLRRFLTEQCGHERWQPTGQSEFWKSLCGMDRQRAVQTVLSSLAQSARYRVFTRDDLSTALDLEQDGDTMVDFACSDADNALVVCDCISIKQPQFWSICFRILEEYALDRNVHLGLAGAVLLTGVVVPIPDHFEECLDKVQTRLADPSTPPHAQPWLEEMSNLLRREVERERRRLEDIMDGEY